MICPHCHKEVDSYIVYGQNANLNLNNGCASGVLSYTYTVANAAASSPLPLPGNTVLNVMGCANQGVLNAHYHTF